MGRLSNGVGRAAVALVACGMMAWTRMALAAVDAVSPADPVNPPALLQASSPVQLSDTTISAIAYILMIGVLLAVVFVGAFLVLNLGLMSRRDQDRTGGRTPSDVGILKSTNWPQEPEVHTSLPASEDAEDTEDEDHRDLPPSTPMAS